MTPNHALRAALFAALSFAAACEPVEKIQDSFRDQTPHEAYATSLAQAGLAETALVRDWLAASREAVAGAPMVQLPFQEEGFIAADEAGAAAYRVRVGRGQRLMGEVTLSSEEGTRVFLDLFRVPDSDDDPLRPVMAVDSVPGTFQLEPWRAGEYILRVQPELLRGGRYRVVLRLEPQLAFPVENGEERDIGSVWGQPRDGGRRSHEGVDIFARRGTPVLATAAGSVRRVRETPIGGKVVWLNDRVRNASIYFAHLDSQAVTDGQLVEIGDTLGFVGNTGNARGTSPHLHFGIYRRGKGAVDPYPFLRRPRGSLAEVDADLDNLGSWVRMREGGIRLRVAPQLRAEVLQELDRYTPLRVYAGSGTWYRVRLPDGATGYVAARLTEPTARAVDTLVASVGSELQTAPSPSAPVIVAFSEPAEIPVLGRFGDYLMVKTAGGTTGWVSDVGGS